MSGVLLVEVKPKEAPDEFWWVRDKEYPDNELTLAQVFYLGGEKNIMIVGNDGIFSLEEFELVQQVFPPAPK